MNPKYDAVITLPDRLDADPSSDEATDNVVHPPVRDDFPEVELDAEDDNADAKPDAGDDVLKDELDVLNAGEVEDFRKPTKPATEPVDGEALFAALVLTFTSHMILPEGAAEVLALWVIHSYAVHVSALPFAVRIIITAPGPDSGKTTLVELLVYLVRRPEPVSDLTDASFFRLGVVVAPSWLASSRPGLPPTVLIDEADRLLPSRESRHPIISKINGGHKKTSAIVNRVETIAKEKVTVRYSVFFPVALAGIGDFAPTTVKTRSFIIKLKRKMAAERVEAFIPSEHAPRFRELREQILRWVLDNANAMRAARPVLDADLYNNRSADNATTLLMIAETIGPNCAKRSRAAIRALTRGDVVDQNGMLLGDLASLLTDPEIKIGDPPAPLGDKDFLLSSDLCALLREHFPHRELYAGFTQARLASMLSTFDIEPEQKRHGSHVLRGYRRKPFNEWMIRYGLIDVGVAEDPKVSDTGSAVMVETETEQHSPPPICKTEVELRNRNPSDDLIRAVAKGEVGIEALDDAALVPGEGEIDDNEPAAEPGASVADALEGATPLQAEVPDQEPTPQPVAPKIVYSNARIVEARSGDKKRGAALWAAVDAIMRAGDAEPEAVAFISARFWIINRDSKACYVHLTGAGELEWSPIAAPGLAAENGTVLINAEKSLSLGDADFLVVRPLVNKYRKTGR